MTDELNVIYYQTKSVSKQNRIYNGPILMTSRLRVGRGNESVKQVVRDGIVAE